MKQAEIKDLARQLRVHRKKGATWGASPESGSAFLVGAGCSRSAGIKLAWEIARDLMVGLAETLGAPAEACQTPESALDWLKETEDHFSPECDFGAAYNIIFEEYYTSGRMQREIIQTVIAEAEEKINWAHVCLGELVNKHYVHTVLTTNFDQLVSRGIIFTGQLPVIADGVESMERIEPVPRFPQVVHLHGSMHTYRPRNGTSRVRETSEMAAMHSTIWNTCRGADVLVVVGYAGREEGVVNVLVEVVRELPHTVIFWVAHEPDDRAIPGNVREILSGPNKYVIYGQDADVFFSELMRLLDEPIDWMENPLQTLFERKIELSDPNVWETELQRDNIDGLRRIYTDRLGRMRDGGALPPEEEKVRQARMASQSGNDDLVIDLLGEFPVDQNQQIAPILALSLLRAGDRTQDEGRIMRSVDMFRRHLSEAPRDFSAQGHLGDAYSALADLLDGQPERAEEVGLNRELAVAAYQAAMDLTPADNRKAWRFAREKFATAVSESGKEGATTETLIQAIAALDALLEDPANDMSRPERAEILNRVAMLRLMCGLRSQQRADFLNALRASDTALQLVDGDFSTMSAIGFLRNNASVRRGLGKHALSHGAAEEGRRELQRAAQLYQRAGEAYLAGVVDADPADYRDAAREAFDEAKTIYGEIGATEISQEIQALFDSIS